MKHIIYRTLAVSLFSTLAVLGLYAAPVSADDRHISPSYLYTLTPRVYCSAGKATVVVPAENVLAPAAAGANDLIVTAQLNEDGPTAEPYRLRAQAWHQFAVKTDQSVLASGHIKFNMTWPDGSGFNDEKGVGFSGKDCRFPVAPSIVRSTPTCTNKTLVVSGYTKLPGISWNPASVSLLPGEKGTLSATIDESISRPIPGAKMTYTVKNNFVCRKPQAKIVNVKNGDPYVRLNNTGSEVAVYYRVKATYHGKTVFDRKFAVPAGKTRHVTLGKHRKFEPGTHISVKTLYNHKVVAKADIPKKND